MQNLSFLQTIVERYYQVEFSFLFAKNIMTLTINETQDNSFTVKYSVINFDIKYPILS
jgi:hypothetical protein